MKALLVAAALLGGSAVAAHAESFTFTSSVALTNQVTAAVAGGKPVIASFSNGSSQTVYASGKRSTTVNACAIWTAAAGQTFQQNGACTYTESNGDTASIVFGCNATNPEQTESNCWGLLTGVGGVHGGKTGTISWHSTQNPDGKSGAANGVGFWND